MTGEEAQAEMARLFPDNYVAAARQELWTNSAMGHKVSYKAFVMIGTTIHPFDADSWESCISQAKDTLK